jgi:hypothetical protein
MQRPVPAGLKNNLWPIAALEKALDRDYAFHGKRSRLRDLQQGPGNP